jgi:hypothetical protein
MQRRRELTRLILHRLSLVPRGEVFVISTAEMADIYQAASPQHLTWGIRKICAANGIDWEKRKKGQTFRFQFSEPI